MELQILIGSIFQNCSLLVALQFQFSTSTINKAYYYCYHILSFNVKILVGPDLGDIDGINQWNAIDGSGNSNRTGFLINIDQIAKNSAIRQGKWKLLQGERG